MSITMEISEVDGLAHALFEQTGDAMFLFDPDSYQVMNANSTAQRLSGFPVRELLRMTIAELFRSETEEGWQQLLRASRHSAVFHSQEGYFLKAVNDEIGIPVNLTAARLHVRPKPLGLITARDVRRQFEAYHQLRRMEAELRRVLDLVSDCLWSAEIDENGKTTYHYLSEGVEDITGIPSSFFLAGFHRWYDIVHPKDLPRWLLALTQQKSGQATNEEYRVIRPDGSSRWVREKVHVSRGTADRGVMRLDGVLTDITEPKRIEHCLNECENRFRAFMLHAPIMTFIKDAEGRYAYVNEGFQKFMRKPAEEILRHKDSDFFDANVSAELAERDTYVLVTGETVQGVERTLGPEGHEHALLVTRFSFDDGNGRRFLAGLAIDLDAVNQLSLVD